MNSGIQWPKPAATELHLVNGGAGPAADAVADSALTVEGAPGDTKGPTELLYHGARVFGVYYDVYQDSAGGILFVTGYGHTYIDRLDPHNWYLEKQFFTRGRRMANTVYCLELDCEGRRPLSLVIKFSRFAQDTLLHVQTTFEGAIQPEMIDQAHFLDPFQEFGLVMELRRGDLGPPDLYISTKAPLAIYRVPTPNPGGHLRSNTAEWDRAKREIDADQVNAAYPVTLEDNYSYALLYHYVRGQNLLEALNAGLVGQDQVASITRGVAAELTAKGFMVLDHKPQHVIVRPRSGALLRRRGRIVYALVDFELLVRTEVNAAPAGPLGAAEHV